MIGIDDIAAAYKQIERPGGQPIDAQGAHESVDAAAGVNSERSLVGLCRDPRHSTGNDVARWLNRLNDGLGDEATRDLAATAATPPATGDLAKQKIADRGDAIGLPEPWWTTLGVDAGDDLGALFARAAAAPTVAINLDAGIATTGDSPVDDWPGDVLPAAALPKTYTAPDTLAVAPAPRQWAPPASRWAPSEWPGCDTFCDEVYDEAWPGGPRHWATENVANDLVAGTADETAEDNRAIGLMVLATSQAASDFAARALSVAVGIARDWSVLLDSRAAEGAITPRVARRPNEPGRAAADGVELSPMEQEQVWCDAARWPYEDL